MGSQSRDQWVYKGFRLSVINLRESIEAVMAEEIGGYPYDNSVEGTAKPADPFRRECAAKIQSHLHDAAHLLHLFWVDAKAKADASMKP